MNLCELLKGIKYEVIQGDINADISSITWDSRDVEKNSLFIAVKNRNVDRHDFAEEAAKKGAVALVTEHEIKNLPENITAIRVKESKKAMAVIARNFYKNPAEKLRLIGITGTNGKTSVSYFISEILEAFQIKCGVIGTIQNIAAGHKMKIQKLNPTTPDSIELHATFAEMLQYGVTHAVMEVTSSALSQDRVYGCQFDIGVFTNLTQDHLEEHGTMENYKNAKMKLFKMCKKGVINIDDAVSKEIIADSDCRIITFGIENPCDFRAVNIRYTDRGVKFDIQYKGKTREVQINVPGRFSVYNALAAIASCCVLGMDIDQVIEGARAIKGVPGRFQSIPNNKNILIIVDYAHSPDAIQNILSSVKEITKGRIISIFGCGGNRDTGKRPIMGEIAGGCSDYCIITSDNPRNEDPESIMDDIEPGMIKSGCRYEKIENREAAIFKALSTAEAGDAVVIAGKGHENYQILKDKTIHFSDEETVREYFSHVKCEFQEV